MITFKPPDKKNETEKVIPKETQEIHYHKNTGLLWLSNSGKLNKDVRGIILAQMYLSRGISIEDFKKEVIGSFPKNFEFEFEAGSDFLQATLINIKEEKKEK